MCRTCMTTGFLMSLIYINNRLWHRSPGHPRPQIPPVSTVGRYHLGIHLPSPAGGVVSHSQPEGSVIITLDSGRAEQLRFCLRIFEFLSFIIT